MAKGVNYHFHGRLGQDPELKYVGANNSPCVNFSVCINMGPDQDPEWEDCTAWGDAALDIAERFRKGDIIYIKQSSPKTSKWTHKGKDYKRKQWRVWEYHGKDEDPGNSGGDLPPDDNLPY